MRRSGILMPITSLASPYGIGTMGKAAFEFVNFLKASGQKIWQILPLSPTSYGDSPYQSFSTFAGNPYMIDLDLLIKASLLTKEEVESVFWGDDSTQVDYGAIYNGRFAILKKACSRFLLSPDEDFYEFIELNEDWLFDYALFMALKEHHNSKSWQEWDEQYKFRKKDALDTFSHEHQDEILFWEFVQYMFFKQWGELRDYANENGIEILGDLPIYVAPDSADIWANPELFELDESLAPINVAGCPPDYFSPTGQLWGNPLYRWDKMKSDGFEWWLKRIQGAKKMYDLIRIDHFRGFESYYAIPAKDKTAEHGQWRKGPGMEFFLKVKERFGDGGIIAEDLGLITDEVRALLRETGYPGMKVLEFAFQAWCDNDYLPHNHVKNCIVYTGTHDNDTLVGWLEGVSENDLEFIKEYLGAARDGDVKNTAKAVVKTAWASVADTAIAQMQDILGLDSEARMNTPSTPMGNWKWRINPDMLTDELAENLNRMTRLYMR